MKRWVWMAAATALAVVAVLLWPSGKPELEDARALDLVKAYNKAKIEAYRTGDAELLDGLVGPIEDRKTGALIATKVEAGMFLDATLETLELIAVTRPAAGGIDVKTRERWSYMDRRIGSGDRVGEASSDRYEMQYHLEFIDGHWVVATIAFAAEPQVGRKDALGLDRERATGHGEVGRGRPPATPPDAASPTEADQP